MSRVKRGIGESPPRRGASMAGVLAGTGSKRTAVQAVESAPM